jgi:hypothetical protein
VIPYNAIRGFYDPSVNFELEFDVAAGEEEEADSAEITAYPLDEAAEAATDESTEKPDGPKGGGASVVSLDSFRKKN